MRYLLDTTALLAHYRRETGWQTVQAYFENEGAVLFVASPSLTEFGRRLRELNASEDEIMEALTTYQQLFSEVVAVNDAVAKVALQIGWRTPRRIPLVDALIAACAQMYNAALVHRDEHMRSIPTGLVQQIDLEQE